MNARLVVLALFHAWCYLGAALLSAALIGGAHAGENTWTAYGAGPCGDAGVASAGAMLACHEEFIGPAPPPVVLCGSAFFGFGPDTSDTEPAIIYWANTVRQFDADAPYDCAAPTNSMAYWQFENA